MRFATRSNSRSAARTKPANRVAGSYLWAWTAVGAAIELLLQIIPVAFGLTSMINVGLARVFFSWTLHAIVFF
jgi:cytochrome c oxidase subunit 1